VARYRWLVDYLGLLLVLLILVATFGSMTNHFFSPTTLLTILNEIPRAAIIAVGMTFVIITGGIDLSVGSVLAMSAAVLSYVLIDLGWPLPLALLASVLTGTAAGVLNGLIVTTWRVPSFIVTLGMLEAARGMAYLATNSQSKYIGAGVQQIHAWQLGGLSITFFIAVGVVLLGQGVLSYTRFGRHVYAIGANSETARLSGINVRGVTLCVFILSGALVGIAAIMEVARLATAVPSAGVGYELEAVAAVVIGGTSLMGGRGSVFHSFIGVLIIAVLAAGLAQLGAGEPTKRLVTGGAIVVAVIVDYYRSRLSGVAQA